MYNDTNIMKISIYSSIFSFRVGLIFTSFVSIFVTITVSVALTVSWTALDRYFTCHLSAKIVSLRTEVTELSRISTVSRIYFVLYELLASFVLSFAATVFFVEAHEKKSIVKNSTKKTLVEEILHIFIFLNFSDLYFQSLDF